MKLSELLEGVAASEPFGDTEIGGVAINSKQVKEGDLFVCLHGVNGDGHSYCDEAIAAGAAAIICERTNPDGGT